jgi:hypothetical protein
MNRNGIFASLVSLTIALGPLAGCQEAPDPPNAPDEPVFTRTVVKVDEQGNTTYEQYEITLSQQQREKRVRALIEQGLPAAIVVDSSCAPASMWMFDQPNLTGNELCLFASPKSNLWSTASLNIFPRGPFGSLGTWHQAVRSLWAGTEFWRFSPTCNPNNCGCDGNPFARLDSVMPCIANAFLVWLRCPTCPN